MTVVFVRYGLLTISIPQISRITVLVMVAFKCRDQEIILMLGLT